MFNKISTWALMLAAVSSKWHSPFPSGIKIQKMLNHEQTSSHPPFPHQATPPAARTPTSSAPVRSPVLQVNSAPRWCAEAGTVPFPPAPTAPTASLWPTVNSRAPPSTATRTPATFPLVRMMRSAKTRTENGMRGVRKRCDCSDHPDMCGCAVD